MLAIFTRLLKALVVQIGMMDALVSIVARLCGINRDGAIGCGII